MGTIRFNLRADKADSEGKQPIELIYQISGRRKYFRTKERLWPECWDQDKQQAIFLDKKKAKELLPGKTAAELLTAKEVNEINDSLNSFTIQIRNIEKRFELDSNLGYSPEDIIANLKEKRHKLKDVAPIVNIFEFIEKYISEHSAIREPGSLQVYKALKNHLHAFQKAKKHTVTFSEMDSDFFRKFQVFLSTPRQETKNDKTRTVDLNNTTIAKQLSTLKTFLGYAKAAKVQVAEGYKDFKISKEKLEVIALSSDEFEFLYNYDLSANRRLDQVRDIFCFACSTGLRYSDLNQLRREHIKDDEIRINVKKTRTSLTIPLNQYSSAIIAKYKENYIPLPVSGQRKLITNQVLNRYIKELCELVGINEEIEIVRRKGERREATVYPKYELISIHTGRKTFVTVSLEKGISIPEVMATSGHSDYASFSRYVNITEKRKKEAMQKAWGIAAVPKQTKSKLKAV